MVCEKRFVEGLNYIEIERFFFKWLADLEIVPSMQKY